MTKVIVAKKFDGTQKLYTMDQILSVPTENAKRFKTDADKSNSMTKDLVDFCSVRGISSLEIFTTDGKFQGWIIRGRIM